MVGATLKGLRFFVDSFGARDMLFDVSVEGRKGRVGTGRLTNV